MVKADVKRDYYADLDLPPTADAEEIKKQFRLLAKQYHPDRNPGHEVEVVPKFQAVQAAHEILSDPVEKAKYDAGRARLAAKTAATASTAYSSDPYGLRPTNSKASPAAKQQFPFPPPPKPAQNRAQFPTANQKQQASSGADKFNAFTRGVPQSWDRAKYDEARAEAARVFPTMRPTSSAQQMPPRSTPRQAPTAPKPPSNAEMPYVPNIPPTSFPGLSRTASSRKPDYHSADAPQFPRSAFSYVQGTRGQPPPNPHIHAPDNQSMRSPPVSRARPAVSPLRHARSSDYDMRSDLLGGRPSSRYAGGGGERTDINGDGIHRSSSVRNSPVDDRGPFGRPSTRYESIPRHRSASPGMRNAGIHADFSETSSSEEEPLHMHPRPKAVPRSRPQVRTGLSYDADNNPGLTGQFPSTNYTRIVDDSRYHYPPPPESKESTRKPFPSMTSPDVEAPKANVFHGDGGGSDKPKYAPFFLDSRTWSRGYRSGGTAQRGYSFNGFPSWAVPSSVFPQVTPPRSHGQNSDTLRAGGSRDFVQSWNNRTNPSFSNDSAQPKVQTTFSAADWHDKVTAEDIFRPDESQTRKSPSKLNRNGSKPTSRGRAQSRSAEHEPASPSEIPNGHGEDKSTAFQPGKLGDDWAARATARQAPLNPRASPGSDTTDDSRDRYIVVEEDAMDVDTPPTNDDTKAPASNGIKYAVNAGPPRAEPKRRSTNGGVDLKDFAQQAPFAPTSAGLKGMKDDLETFLPFESRASNEVNLNSTPSARIRALNLPKPPKIVIPPAEDRLDKTNFAQYVENMEHYMGEWNKFNAKMIEHFRARQDRVCGTMSPHWIAQPSDGPGADALDADGSGDKKAGYGAYMQWLKDDAQCRNWWEEANEKHLQCLEDLGRTRQVAKRTLRP
ncbi:uncharacterized protein Z520_04398 [Fonsecaea multimorphosa CBS 102226]|uniref:J domain-containing protein n=1 Tax=Fonsecaea multimorphosa CBS 102226 TaxID=1442371 RepID=A0A0D2K1M1_9EURO|nr:uncharacterized protein Z520_04398 [Fonsecaea multimorphosa CBS 102226]KIX99762.1 hypothetical protein Z520_04398 [Fonsecaea multimorphosa CBS 102226]OAL26550.1 hypothetical protein AYO22_04161 [Fonsecaea multimorphosa]